MRRVWPIPTHSRWLAPAIAIAVLSSCASLSESQCIAGDWQTVGFRDGSAGNPQSMLLQHQDACVKHGVIPQRESYLDGWTQGVRNYCTPENGFAIGDRGSSYANVCPDDLEPSFYAALLDGRRLFNARSEINDLERQLGYKEKRLQQIKQDINAKEAEIFTSTSSELRRRQLLAETKELAKEQGLIEEEIATIRANVAVKRDRLDDLRHALAYNG